MRIKNVLLVLTLLFPTAALAQYQGNLRSLFDASAEELSQIRGVGRVKALELMAAFALSKPLT